MNGRDSNGRFAPGNQIAKGNGGGRPKKPREERYYEILMSTCTFDDWRLIIKKAVEQAKKGDKDARKWLSDRLVGPPVQRLEHTGADGGAVVIQYGGNVDPDEV